jgi:hypothetical protein
LHHAWQLASTRFPERTAGQSLTLAERAIASLLRSRLIVLTRAAGSEAAQQQQPIADEEAPAVLSAIASWTDYPAAAPPGDSGSVWICRV